ncbi:MAG: SDR family NAD(P)-dependent oxidoreductase, partial [Planctomycetaceae bacterium]
MVTINLDGKIALVTGGGQGLGQATARLLHEAGATVVINYLDDDSGTGRTRAVQTVTPFGNRGLAVAADVRSRADLQALMQQ